MVNFAAVALAVFLFAVRPGLVLAEEHADKESGQIVWTVTAFYDEYLLYSGCPGYTLMKLPPYLLSRADVEPAFARKIDALITGARQPEGEVGLNYDPILMAQDVPLAMSFDPPDIDGASAWLIARMDWGRASSSLCVSLNKDGETWRIADVSAMEREGSGSACEGVKPRSVE